MQTPAWSVEERARQLDIPESIITNGPTAADLKAADLSFITQLRWKPGDAGDATDFVIWDESGRHEISRTDLRGIIEQLGTMSFEGRESRGSRMLTNLLVDFAIFFMLRLGRLEHIRVLGTVETAGKRKCMERYWTDILPRERDLAHQLIAGGVSSEAAKESMAAFKLKKLDRLRRASLAPRAAAYLMDPTREEEPVSAVLIPELDSQRAHFHFSVLDAEKAWRVTSPKIILFDTIKGDPLANMDAAQRIYDFAHDSFIAPMARPLAFESANIHQSDDWSCGYQTLARLADVAAWLSENRKYIEEKELFVNQSPLLQRNAIYTLSVDKPRCRNIFAELQQTALYLYFYGNTLVATQT